MTDREAIQATSEHPGMANTISTVQFAPVAPSGAELVDVHDVAWAVWRRRGRILASGLALTVLVLVATFFLGMRFRASAQMYLGELAEKGKGEGDASGLDLASVGSGAVASEIEILQSRAIVKRAVLKSGLNTTLSRPGASSLPYWRWRASGRKPALLDPVLREVRVSDAVLPETSLDPRRYELEFQAGGAYAILAAGQPIGHGVVGQVTTAAELQLTVNPGTVSAPPAGARYDLVVWPADRAVDKALSVLKVTAPKETATGDLVNVLTLEFTCDSPRLAATFLEQLMETYLSERQSWKTENASAAEAFAAEQLGSVRESLKQLESKLAEYRSRNPSVVLDDAAKSMVEQVGRYEEQRATARLEVAALGDIRSALAQPNPPKGAFLLGQANDTVFSSMAQSLSEARDKLTLLESRFNDAAPEVREQRAQVDAQLESIRNYVISKSNRAEENLRALDAIIEQFDAKLRSVPTAELGLTELARESDVYNKTYAYLLERQQQAALVKASTLSKNRVLYSPEVPLREDSPNLLLRAGAFFVGASLAAAIVALRTIFSSRLRSRADVARSIGWLPVLAVIPARRARREKRSPRAASALELTRGTHEPAVLEAFRTARTNLYTWPATRSRGRVLVFTSPSRGDGKTSCALSFAAVLAADGKRVAFVDADLRDACHPGHVPGLSAVLRGECSWRQAAITTDIDGAPVTFLSSGNEDSPELLSGPRMFQLVTQLRDEFDFVVLDAPSFPEAADALSLSRLADGTLTILRIGHTSRALSLEHCSQLAVHVQRHGLLVLNDEARGSAARARRRPRPGPKVPLEPLRASRVSYPSARGQREEEALEIGPVPAAASAQRRL